MIFRNYNTELRRKLNVGLVDSVLKKMISKMMKNNFIMEPF